MKPFILAALCLSAFAHPSLAQLHTPRRPSMEAQTDRNLHDLHNAELELHKIVVKWEKDPEGEYRFTCENKTFSSYIVEVRFDIFENLQTNIQLPARITVQPGYQPLFTMKKITKGPAHFNYHYHVFRGCTNPKVDMGFTYLLPVAPGKETRIFVLKFIGEEYNDQSEPKGWYALGFHVHSGDTVFATRRGRVTEVRDGAKLTDSGYTYASGENLVEIQHNDCSFGRYTVFRDSAIFVQPGDWVEAGQPLGLAGGDRYEGGPQVRFLVRYNLEQEILKDSVATGGKYPWAFVPLQFWTKGQGSTLLPNNAYVSDHPADLVTKEMSKREAKKWMETHKGN